MTDFHGYMVYYRFLKFYDSTGRVLLLFMNVNSSVAENREFYGPVYEMIRWFELARSAYLAYYLLSMLELLYNSKIDVFCKNFANIFAQNLSFSRLLFGPF